MSKNFDESTQREQLNTKDSQIEIMSNTHSEPSPLKETRTNNQTSMLSIGNMSHMNNFNRTAMMMTTGMTCING